MDGAKPFSSSNPAPRDGCALGRSVGVPSVPSSSWAEVELRHEAAVEEEDGVLDGPHLDQYGGRPACTSVGAKQEELC
uniref:Uncharacterized protein n=1 Tax=Timema cristinae TaxID=61476 RepID=A0A7R9D0Y0_TIMCR|nr:unnamed protein product [Timema cristinae]